MTEGPNSKRGYYELAINAVVIAVVGIGVVWNMPTSPIQQSLAAPLQPLALASGLDQRWQMYAPNPIRQLEDVEVLVTMADGSTRSWTNPRGDLIIGPFVWYRWQKLKENLVRDPEIRPDVAHWVVDQVMLPGEKAERVQLFLRTKQLLPPGHTGPGATETEVLYDEDLAEQP